MSYDPRNPCPRCHNATSDNVYGYIWICRKCKNAFDNKSGKWADDPRNYCTADERQFLNELRSCVYYTVGDEIHGDKVLPYYNISGRFSVDVSKIVEGE